MQARALRVRGEADVGQADGEGVKQGRLAVAYGGVAAHVGLDLRLAAALRGEDGKGQQLPLRDGEKFAGIEVAEAAGGQIVLDVLLVFRRGGAHGVDVRAEDGLLRGDAVRKTALLRDGLSACQREGDAFSANTSLTTFTAFSAFPRPM